MFKDDMLLLYFERIKNRSCSPDISVCNRQQTILTNGHTAQNSMIKSNKRIKGIVEESCTNISKKKYLKLYQMCRLKPSVDKAKITSYKKKVCLPVSKNITVFMNTVMPYLNSDILYLFLNVTICFFFNFKFRRSLMTVIFNFDLSKIRYRLSSFRLPAISNMLKQRHTYT